MSSCAAGRLACRCPTANARPRSRNCSPAAPHGGSQTFVVGEPDLSAEKSNGTEVSLNHMIGPVHVTANLYYSRFRASFSKRRPGDPRTTCRSSSSLPQSRLLRLRGPGRRQFGQALGVDWGGELKGDGSCDDQGVRPGAAIPPFGYCRADRYARPARWPDRVEHVAAQTALRPTKRRRPAIPWSTPRSTGTRSPPIRR